MMGTKRLKGKGILHEEVKKPVQLRLTPTAIASLDAFATQLNISRSEFVERLARGDGEAIALLMAKPGSPVETEPANKKKKGHSLHELRKLMGTHEPAQTRKTEK